MKIYLQEKVFIINYIIVSKMERLLQVAIASFF